MKKFTLFNILGCLAWVAVMILSGYYLGKAIPGLGDHLFIIVVVMVAITTGPVLFKILFGKKKISKSTLPSDAN